MSTIHLKNLPYILLFIAIFLLLSPIHGQQGIFLENKNQFHPNVEFQAHLPYGKLFLEKGRLTYLLHHTEDFDALHEHLNVQKQDEYILRSHAFRVNFVGANDFPYIRKEKKGMGYFNYFIGDNPAKWASKVYAYNQLTYEEVYPNIDLVFRNTSDGIKYDWVIGKDANPKDIVMEYEGVDSLSIKENRLHIYTSVGEIIEEIPLCYSTSEVNKRTAERNEVSCSYKVDGNKVYFSVEKPRGYGLVIDPKLIFSTYSGSWGDNFGFTATYDSRGNLYAGGITDGSDTARQYPVTNGAFQDTFRGGVGISPANLACDITISKYDSAGENLLFATYLGGSKDDYPHSLVVNNQDELFVMGTTYSNNFPTSNKAYDKSFNSTGNQTDIIVAKFSPDGTKLLASTYIGGKRNDGLISNSALMYNYADDFRGDIIPDDQGNVFIASATNSDDFPRVDGDSNKNNIDGVCFKFNEDLTQLLWSTHVGGKGDDALYSVKLDEFGNVYVGGGTTSDDLKTDTFSYQKDFNGSTDGMLAKYGADYSLKQLSYWGTSSKDQVYFLQLDQRGNLFVNGLTEGTISPSPNTYNVPKTGQFILKMDTLLRKVEIQTVVGKRENNPDIAPSAFLVDHCDNIYLSGWGSVIQGSRNGSTQDLPVTNNAIQKTTDGSDFYLMVLRKDMDSLLYATYFGGDETSDHVDGGTSRFDKRGVVYQSVCSSCPSSFGNHHNDFPISTGAAFDTNYSPRCSNAAFKIDLQISSAVIASFYPDPVIGCTPLEVKFINNSVGGIKYEWDFGDGNTDTAKNPIHTYSKPGRYTIKLKVIDSFACNIFDETIRDLVVLDSTKANFTADYNVCTKEFSLENNSEFATSWSWDFGNGETSAEEQPSFKYEDIGNYDITLITNPGTLCADTLVQNIDIRDLGLGEAKWGNVITPNGDGKNDCWEVRGIDIDCHELRFTIFNRWGQELYKGEGVNDCWDGTIQKSGKKVVDGTYYYVVEVKIKGGHTIESNGVITVIR